MKPKFLLIIPLTVCLQSYSQQSFDSVLNKINPEKWSAAVEKKLSSLENKIIAKTERSIRKLQKQEAKLKKMLFAVDSVNAKNIFGEAQQKYAQLSKRLKSRVSFPDGRMSGEYLPYLDSLKGSLSFLNENNNFLSAAKSAKVSDALNVFNEFENKLHQADAIKEFIKERKQQFSDILNHYSSLPGKFTNALAKYNKETYYYSQQIREYKEIFRDPDKLLQKTLVALNKLPAFQQFMKEHSELAGLFTIPNSYASSLAISGLQTRDQVQQIIASRFGGNGSAGQIFSQQVQAAQSQLDRFKEKLNALGGGSGDIDMPNFKPNAQRTKTFFERLEFGTNMQSTKSNVVFPTTTDLSFMVGYRIDDKKIAGLGIGGKIGWGKDIHHIAVTGQGLNFRSFIDVKIKSSFYASGGFEYNYQKPFNELQQVYDLNEWQESGLLGVTKIVSIKNKVFKKTKLQLLWDFLSYKQIPKAEPIKFRVGYNF